MQQSPPVDPKRFWISVSLGVLAGTTMMLVGYGLSYGGHASMGWVVFGMVPVITGFIVAMLAKDGWPIAAAVVASLLLSLGILFFTGLEGIICVAMAAPFIMAAASIGAAVGYVLMKLCFTKRPTRPGAPMILLTLTLSPLMIGMASHLEKPYRETETLETFTSSVDLPVSPDHAWRLLAQMKPLDGPRPFLIRRGLPLPTHCELESEAVGAKRICHFDQGRMEQTITAWDPARHMAVRVDSSTLPGRLWLRFDSASYDLQAIPGGTRITRHTTIGTRLYPRWYWRPLERWGVTTEHAYVLANIQSWAKDMELPSQEAAADSDAAQL